MVASSFREKCQKAVADYLPACLFNLYAGEAKTNAGKDVATQRTREVISAYAKRNPTIDQNARLNMMATTLLMFLDVDCAFCMLVHFLERVLCNYFSTIQSGFEVDLNIFQKLLKEKIPDVYRHFKKIKLPLSALLTPWFMWLFVECIPEDSMFDIWDGVVSEGFVAVFSASLAILDSMKHELLLIDNPEKLIQHVRAGCKSLDRQRFQELLQRFKLDNKAIELQRGMQDDAEKSLSSRLIREKCAKLSCCTHFSENELHTLWDEFQSIDPYLSLQTGLSEEQFTRLILGTFSQWWVDKDLIKRLFDMNQRKGSNQVHFEDLVRMLSVVWRGNPDEFIDFNFQLFSEDKPCISKSDFYRLLQSAFGMYRCDRSFDAKIRETLAKIFKNCAQRSDTIIPETFARAVTFLPDLLAYFEKRNPKIAAQTNTTYIYWLLKDRKTEQKQETDKEKEKQKKQQDILEEHISMQKEAISLVPFKTF